MITTIQRTAKRWKLLQIIGFLIALVGAAMTVSAMGDAHRNEPFARASMMTLGAGLGAVLLAKAGAWWHHA